MSGYLDKSHPAFDEYKSNFVNSALNGGCRIIYLHTSGHASVDEIKKICEITQAKTIIPIHSEKPELLKDIIPSGEVVILQDKESFVL